VPNRSHVLVDTEPLYVERRPTCFYSIKIRHPDSTLFLRLSSGFHCDWPVDPGSVARSGTVLWLSPGEWAIVDSDILMVETAVSQACRDTLHTVVEMHDAFTVYDISGSQSRMFLSKSCSLDLHPRVFREARCAQTVFAQVYSIIVRPGPSAALRVYAESAYTTYLDEWLIDSAAEYATRTQVFGEP
jgi:sarcosine oxidase subunit gamma